eukprot:COSAG06_NODE_392_length_16344_cov_4.086981_11_plen_73_part_00
MPSEYDGAGGESCCSRAKLPKRILRPVRASARGPGHESTSRSRMRHSCAPRVTCVGARLEIDRRLSPPNAKS